MRSIANRAFTLVEVLLVIVIIGILATVVVFTVGGRQEGAAIDTTRIQLQKLSGRLDEYKLNIGDLPSEDVGGLEALVNPPDDEAIASKWRGPYVKSQELKDAWGQPFNYEINEAASDNPGEAEYYLWSNGPNKENDNRDNDDIVLGAEEADEAL